MTIFCGFSWFFQKWDFAESWGFLRCDQCIKTLHLSYQTARKHDFHFLPYNGVVRFFRPLVRGVKIQFWNFKKIFSSFSYKTTPKTPGHQVYPQFWEKWVKKVPPLPIHWEPQEPTVLIWMWIFLSTQSISRFGNTMGNPFFDFFKY
jgi:hypothetical protein